MVERFTYGNFELTKRRWPTRRHSRAGVKKEIPRIFIPRRLYPFLPSFLFSAARIPARRTRLSIRAIREIALPRTGRIEPRSTRDKVSRIETYPMGRGGSVAFYALNVHSEVGRRWKRDKAAVFRLFLRRGGFAARSFVFRQGTEREDAPFAPLVPRGTRVASRRPWQRDKNLGRYISAGCAASTLTANVRIPYLQRARPGARPGFVALRRHFGIYICCETFSPAKAPHDPICCPRFSTKSVIFLMGMM